MKPTKKFILLLVASPLVLNHGLAFPFSLFGSKNYEECILENMKGVKNDKAANAIEYACASKFQLKSSASKAKKPLCNGEEIDTEKYAEVEFPVPNDFGSFKILRLGWEPSGRYSSENLFRVHLQHSYPYSIQGFYLQGFTSKNTEDASYWCSGLISPNAVGTAICQNIQPSSKTFGAKAVITTRTNLYQLLKSIKKCD